MSSNPLPLNSCRYEGCTLTGALSVTTSIRDSATIVHGPAGCSHHNFSLLHTVGLERDTIRIPQIISSGMLEPDIVFGGEDALRRAIRSAVTRDVTAIYVLTTCIVETIGDDVAKVCNEAWPVPVHLIPTAGFLGGSFQTGMNNALLALAATAPPAPRNERPDTVNVIGEKNLEYEVEENFSELVRLLSLLKLSVNLRFVHEITTADFCRLGSASLNILRDEGMDAVGEELSDRFGTPYLSGFPTGLSGTLRFLRLTADICGIEPDEAVEGERAFQESIVNDFFDIDGHAIRLDAWQYPLPEKTVVSEIVKIFNLKVCPDGARVPVPLSPPVGTLAVRRLLHRWRCALLA